MNDRSGEENVPTAHSRRESFGRPLARVGGRKGRPAIDAADHAAARVLFARGCPDLAGSLVTIDLRPDGVTRLVIHSQPADVAAPLPEPVCVEVGDPQLKAAVERLCALAVAMTRQTTEGVPT